MRKMVFTHKAIRVFAASRWNAEQNPWARRRSAAPTPIDGPDYTVETRHTSREAAERTARSAEHQGYVGILKSGRVEEIRSCDMCRTEIRDLGPLSEALCASCRERHEPSACQGR